MNYSDCNKLQDDLNSLSVWSDRWLLKFNAGKCVVMKIRKKLKYKYSLNGVYLEEVNQQKDLGITISNDLSPRNHIVNIVKKANQRVGMIRRCFSNLTPKKVKTLYVTMVRPVIEYGSPTWSPNYIKDIKLLEGVQKRCIRLANGELKLPSLSTRRLEIDLCEVYKYLHDHYRNGKDKLFTPAIRQLGGHAMKLHRPNAKSNPRYNFFAVRIVKYWNDLPEDIINAPSLTLFKRKLSILLEGVEG